MFDIDALTTAFTILAAVAATLLLTRVLGEGDPADVATLFGRPWELAWPRGVQEDEPEPWRLDRLDALRPAQRVRPRPVAVDAPRRERAEADLAA